MKLIDAHGEARTLLFNFVYIMVKKCGIHKRQHRSACALSIVVGAALLHSAPEHAFAFQSAFLVRKNCYPGCTSLEMVETLYPFQREDRITSFLGPLLPNDYEQWPRPRRSRNGSRGLLSTSSLIFSSKGRFSFLEDSNLFDDDGEESLEYLPSGGTDLTPKTRELLQRVTSEYVNKREPMVEVDEVLDVIDEEYKSRDVAVVVGEETFDFSSSGDVDDADVARILSFAAHHRLPLDVTLILFGPANSNTNHAFAKCRKALGETGSWTSVRFPQGLAIRPKRKFVTSTRKRFMPVPRTWTTSRKEAVRNAQLAVNEASFIQPPPRRLLTREEFLATIDKELSGAASEPTELLPLLFRDARLFSSAEPKA